MDSKNKKIVKTKIETLISKAELDILELEKNTQPVSPENSIGRVSRMDAINNKSVLEAALRNKKKQLSKLKTALSKIDKESFGKCTLCNQEIPVQRLIYMPESDRCVRCADR